MTTYNETPIRKVIPAANYPDVGGRMIARHPVGATLHVIVGTLPGCTAHFQNPSTGYATNYAVGSVDGRGGGEWQIHEYVPAEFVAWGNGNTDLNTRSVSIEHENDLRIGLSGKPRPEVHELSARFLARLAVRFDWRIDGRVQLIARDFPEHDYYGRPVPGFGVEFNVITHRSVAMKDCPKDLDFGLIVRRANQIIQAGPAGLEPEPIEEEPLMPGIVIVQNTASSKSPQGSKWGGGVYSFAPGYCRRYVGDREAGGANTAARRIGQDESAPGVFYVRVSSDAELLNVAHAHGIGTADLSWLQEQTQSAQVDHHRIDYERLAATVAGS